MDTFIGGADFVPWQKQDCGICYLGTTTFTIRKMIIDTLQLPELVFPYYDYHSRLSGWYLVQVDRLPLKPLCIREVYARLYS